MKIKSLPRKVLSRDPMGGARHPGTYKPGTRKQMTRDWKMRVKAKLEKNKEAGIRPGNIPELAALIAPGNKNYKPGLYRALDPDGDQVSSADVDVICRLLNIDPPLVEAESDEDLQRDLDIIRALSREDRRAVIDFIVATHRKAPSKP